MDWIKLTPETRPKLDEMVLCVCNLRSSPYYHEVYYGEDSDDFKKEES